MLLKALDLLRTLGWKLVYFIYNLIDSLFDILKGLNAFDIINSVSGDNNFVNFQKGVIAIAVTLLGLFAITRFAKKIIDPDESQSSERNNKMWCTYNYEYIFICSSKYIFY